MAIAFTHGTDHPSWKAIIARIGGKCPICKNPSLRFIVAQPSPCGYGAPQAYFKCPTCGELSVNEDWLPDGVEAKEIR